MKKLIRQAAAGLLGAAILAAPAFAQEFRVGFVNTDRIFREANSSKSAQAKLEQEFSRREKELNDTANKLKAAADKLALYPDGSATELRNAIASRYGLLADNIVCGAGSDELLQLLAHSYLGPGDEAIYSQYGFLVYPIAIQSNGATPVVAPGVEFAGRRHGAAGHWRRQCDAGHDVDDRFTGARRAAAVLLVVYAVSEGDPGELHTRHWLSDLFLHEPRRLCLCVALS